MWSGDGNTHHLKSRDGTEEWVVTHARSRLKFARISSTGKVHIIDKVIVRWNFMGGTRERPDVTFVLKCGPQTHHPQPAVAPHPHEICARCESKGSSRYWPSSS